MTTINAAQVRALFEREAVLLGAVDGVPESRAAALFGEDAVGHARRLNSSKAGVYANGYGVGDFTMEYLTYRGFQAAASFYNVQVLRKEAEGHG